MKRAQPRTMAPYPAGHNGLARKERLGGASEDDAPAALEDEIARVAGLGVDELRVVWRKVFRQASPPPLSKDLLARMITWRLQEKALGGLDRDTAAFLNRLGRGEGAQQRRRLRPGTVLVREYQGERH